MTFGHHPPGTLLWATTDLDVNREPVEAAAKEFGIAVRFCTPGEIEEVLRSARSDIVGIDLGVEPRPALAILKALHEKLPRLTILAASRDASVAVMRAALEAGASDVLSVPVNTQELHKALIKFTQLSVATAARPAVGEIITVCGARGGLGATTVAVNLAVRLASHTGGDVGLVDLDLQRGDVATFLNLTPSQSLAAIPAARGEVDAIFLHGILTRHASGVFVLSAPTQMDEADAVGHGDVKVALDVLSSQFRYTVIDTPRTIVGATLAAFECSDYILVIADLSVPGVRGAQRTVDLLKRINTPVERIRLLITEAIEGPVELKEATRTIGKEPFLVIPRDLAAASKAMNSGSPLNGARPTGLSLTIGQLAARLTGTSEAGGSGRGRLLRRFFSKEKQT